MSNIRKEVYKIVSKIPKGKVMTYGQIGRIVGISPRLVGFALHKNPDLKNIPCHRVVGKSGHLTGYVNGIRKKRELLKTEKVKFKGALLVDLEFCNWDLFRN